MISVSAMPMSPEVHQVLITCAHAGAGVEARVCAENGHENDENPFGSLTLQYTLYKM